MEELDSTWKETERRIKTDGFREGAAQGREETFQKGFDDGYAEGFDMGHTLGRLKALHEFRPLLGQTPIPQEAAALFSDPRKGDCLVCKATASSGKVALPDSVYDNSYESMTNQQTELNNKQKTVIKEMLGS